MDNSFNTIPEISNIIKDITRLHAEGNCSGAHQLAIETSVKHPGNLALMQIISSLRMEMLSHHSSDQLADLVRTLKRTSQSIAQAYVRDILKDNKYDDPKRLERFGYCVASQNEEDGMLAEVFRRIGETSRTFFEFGVGSGNQNITFHMLLNGWKGWWIEINPPKVKYIRKYFEIAIRENRLVVDDTFIDAENINHVCQELGIPNEIDLLSIDIDGNDYHVFESLSAVRPRVVVLEYNPLYPPPMRLVGAYDRNYKYSETSYIGASLSSLVDLAAKKGYQLVGTSISGINAVFVRSDLAGDKFATPATAENLYNPPRYQLSFTGGFGAGIRANFGPLHG